MSVSRWTNKNNSANKISEPVFSRLNRFNVMKKPQKSQGTKENLENKMEAIFQVVLETAKPFSKKGINERRQRRALSYHNKESEEKQDQDDWPQPPFLSNPHKRPQLSKNCQPARHFLCRLHSDVLSLKALCALLKLINPIRISHQEFPCESIPTSPSRR